MSIMGQLIDALVALKNSQVEHRDIKPDNIFYKNHDGKIEVVLGDLGIARQEKSDMTKAEIKDKFCDTGTRQYLPPEEHLSAI